MTICPQTVKAVAVSTTISPVTRTALVAVNNASTRGKPSPSVVVSGIISARVPTTITSRKLSATVWAGCVTTADTKARPASRRVSPNTRKSTT